MSRIRYVGGNIIKTTKGDYNMHSLEDIIFSSNQKVIETAEQGIFYGDPDPFPEREEEPLALACVEFLPGEGPDPEQNPYAPKERYNGLFGFDYFRKKNSSIREEMPYFDALSHESGFYDVVNNSNKKRYNNKREQYEALKKEYKKHKISYRTEKEIVQGWEAEQWTYFVPYLTLYSQEYINTLTGNNKPVCEAYLSLSVEISEDLNALEFDYDKALFSHSLEQPLQLKKCSSELHICNLKLTCLKDFDQEQDIYVYAYPKGSHAKSPAERSFLRKIAGRLTVLPNSEKHRKKLKVLAVQIETDVMNTKKVSEYQQGEFLPNQIEQFHKFCHQAYIEPEIEYFNGNDGSPYLDLTKDSRFKEKAEYVAEKGKMRELSYSNHKECQDYLNKYIPEAKKDFLILYFFGAESQLKGNGGVSLLNSKRCFIYEERTEEDKKKNQPPKKLYDATPAHEAGHALGLWHTFYDNFGEYFENGKYYFQASSTNNLMDYNVPRYFLYKWQWDILRTGMDRKKQSEK